MAWHAQLDLRYTHAPMLDTAGRTQAKFLHKGPLRVLQSLYPEGDAVCHNVLVHPPGGIVGGDTLHINVDVGSGAHALITTPGATRFYKSTGEPGTQQAQITLHDQARLEWLPLETICYNGCNAHNSAEFDLAPQAEMIAWDITALGLPHAKLPFERGSLQQHIEIKGAWLERALIDAADTLLLRSPLGLAGNLCMGTLFFATGSAIPRHRREPLLDALRAIVASDPLAASSGVTAPNSRVIVVRTLAPMTEPAMQLLRKAWIAMRQQAWDMHGVMPRIWAM